MSKVIFIVNNNIFSPCDRLHAGTAAMSVSAVQMPANRNVLFQRNPEVKPIFTYL